MVRDGRRYVWFSAQEERGKRDRGESYVPWGYYLVRTRDGLPAGPLHHHCAVERLGATELPDMGGRWLQCAVIRDGTTEWRPRGFGLPAWLEVRRPVQVVGPNTDRCVVCATPLASTTGRYRLRIVLRAPSLFAPLFPGVNMEQAVQPWRIVLPPNSGLAPVSGENLLDALATLGRNLHEGWTVNTPRYTVTRTPHELTFGVATYDGMDGSIGVERQIQGSLQSIETYRHDITTYLSRAAEWREHLAAELVTVEALRARSGQRFPRARLAEFIGRLEVVRDWTLEANALTLNLWPVKLHGTSRGVELITTPTSIRLTPSGSQGFSFSVTGHHPHYAGGRYCAGQYADELHLLLARGALLQGVHMMLGLRRGWNESDAWENIHTVAEAAIRSAQQHPNDYQFYEDGETGELVPFIREGTRAMDFSHMAERRTS